MVGREGEGEGCYANEGNLGRSVLTRPCFVVQPHPSAATCALARYLGRAVNSHRTLALKSEYSYCHRPPTTDIVCRQMLAVTK